MTATFPRILSGVSSASTAASTALSSGLDGPPMKWGYSPRAEGKNMAANTPGLRLVSLGSHCGVRQSIKKVGRDAESLPFDWMKTRVEGILHYLRNDFDGFFHFVTQQNVPGFPTGVQPMIMYRDWMHSFWHDDPTDAKEQEKYRRRFERFNNLGATCNGEGKTLLFVRSVANVDELRMTDELLQELMIKFGPTTKLLLIVGFQHTTQGAVTVQDRQNLLVYFLEPAAFCNTDAPYEAPIECAVSWALGNAISGKSVPNAQALMGLSSFFVPVSIMGLDAFEQIPTRERPAQPPVPHSTLSKPRASAPPPAAPLNFQVPMYTPMGPPQVSPRFAGAQFGPPMARATINRIPAHMPLLPSSAHAGHSGHHLLPADPAFAGYAGAPGATGSRNPGTSSYVSPAVLQQKTAAFKMPAAAQPQHQLHAPPRWFPPVAANKAYKPLDQMHQTLHQAASWVPPPVPAGQIVRQ